VPTISIARTTTSGFETIELNNGTLALALIPALGCKISQLTDLRNGRQWLWRNPRAPYQRLPHGSAYVPGADTGGWDECFPTVAACVYPSEPWQGAAIQDHGELWSQEPELDIIQTDDVVVFESVWKGVALPYVFERILTVNAHAATCKFEYSVTNTGDAPLDWIWSSHPLLAIEPGMQLLVPASARFNVASGVPRDLFPQRSGLHYPLTIRDVDLTTLPDASAKIGMKLWSDPLTEGWATLRAADGEFRMRWDVSQLPQLGIFMNLGAWSPDGGTPNYNLGLEPCIGAQDSLAEAITQYRLFETLAPSSVREWALAVELAAHDKG
jgi:hypothetical protein